MICKNYDDSKRYQDQDNNRFILQGIFPKVVYNDKEVLIQVKNKLLFFCVSGDIRQIIICIIVLSSVLYAFINKILYKK